MAIFNKHFFVILAVTMTVEPFPSFHVFFCSQSFNFTADVYLHVLHLLSNFCRRDSLILICSKIKAWEKCSKTTTCSNSRTLLVSDLNLEHGFASCLHFLYSLLGLISCLHFLYSLLIFTSCLHFFSSLLVVVDTSCFHFLFSFLVFTS